MEFINAQFSLKFEPQIYIRRKINDIEDLLKRYYNVPKLLPMPDDFAAEAPRIILSSKHGHSQIIFSQISVDVTVNFEGEFTRNFGKTKNYLLERVMLLKDLLPKIQIMQYYFCGIIYNFQIDTNGQKPVDYLKSIVNGNIDDNENVYEIAQRISTIVDNKFFVNRQASLYREFNGNGSNIPDLFTLTNNEVIAEGVNIGLDVNDRYSYMKSGKGKNFDLFADLLEKFYKIIESQLRQWR